MWCRVAGVTFDDRQVHIAKLKKTDILYLEAEPENKFDKNAIAVKHGNTTIGYIPRKLTHRFNAGRVDWRIVGGGDYAYGLRIRMRQI